VLSPAQCSEFEETGVLRLEQAVEPAAIGEMRDSLWEFMARVHGLARDDPTTWSDGDRPTGFQKLVGSDAFAKMASPTLCAAADELLGPGASRTPKHWGPPLPAFPDASPWRVPHQNWHMDVPALPGRRCWGLRAFVLLDRIEPRGGGTLVATGSQRVARRIAHEAGQRMKSAEAKRVLRETEPWIRDLLGDCEGEGETGERERFLTEGRASDATPLRVVELVGDAGDLVLMDLCSLHSVSTNTRATPRLMVGQGLYRVTT
jgi:hypothetical protein